MRTRRSEVRRDARREPRYFFADEAIICPLIFIPFCRR